MNVQVFGITDQQTLEPLPDTSLSQAWQEDVTHRWIDVEAATQEELRTLLAPLGLHAAILEAALQPQRSERLISHRTALYLEVPTHLGWNEPERPYLSILCLKTTILTIHRDPLHTIEDIIHGLDAEIPLYAQSSSALFYYLLMELGKCNVEAALAVRSEAEQLDQTCHEQPEKLDPREIAELRRKVSHYSSVHDDHTYCAGVLQTVESEAFRVSDQAQFFHEMVRLSELSRQLIGGAESRVDNLQRDYEMVVQNRVDNRLRFLTILSAILLPSTLISGIYGMNFNDLPWMGLPYGYVFVILLMLGTAGLTGVYLYWQGWFE